MNFGPRKIVISIAAIPAISTCPRSIDSEPIAAIGRDEALIARRRRRIRAVSASVNTSSPTDRDPLTSTASPSPIRPRRPAPRRLGIGGPLIGSVVARQLADADQLRRCRAAGVRPASR